MQHIVKKLIFCIFILTTLTPSVLTAKHIVGGDITYKFVSSSSNVNRYEFTMKIYRDCDATGTPPPAQLDANAIIGVYAKRSGRFIGSYVVPLLTKGKIGPPSFPCLIPPDVCVEVGTYIWEKDMPIIDDTYVIVYQRCCRNEAITNIIRPGSVGATYSVEITNLSQEVGNSSPTFRSFPPTVICAAYPINFNHSAIDAEGDQLVYKFCEPFTGGGQFDIGGTCESVVPNPPCWPPIGNIRFKEPDFSFLKPMGGDPVVTIDANTGMITGKPTEQGLYVVSVCVEEYRNGKLLSVLKRDFQFDVEPCDPTIRAEIKADTVIGDTYFIRTCGEKNVDINNLSLDRRYINDFRFDIGISGATKTFKDWEPKVSFPDTGVYKGNLYLNPGTLCGDTINLVFNIFNSVKPDFTYKYDTCVAGAVAFTDKTISFNGPVVKYKWEFGDGKDTSLVNPSYLYGTPGTKNVRLTVLDSKGCKKDTSKRFLWQPVPPLLIIQPSTFSGCTPGSIFFSNLSKPIDSTYSIKWTFGDGGTSSVISPTYSYSTPGTYSVSVEVTSPIGCKTSRSFKDWIKINQGTKADFEYSPQRISTFNNVVNFTDKSTFATRWQWFFDNKGFSSKQNPIYAFKDSGIYRVKLIVANQFGCTDSLTKNLDVEPRVTYWLPNAFTPNDDGTNDVFKGIGIVGGMQSFSLKIFNRWGELIFESNNPNEGWNGQKYNTGEQSPQGVYLCLVTYANPRGEKFELRSYATLIR